MLQPNIIARLSAGVMLYLLAIVPIYGQKSDLLSISIPNQKLNNLLQGRIYFPNYIKVVGSQYITEDWRMGEIKLMDEIYRDLPLWYDIYTDDLILLDWKGIGFGMLRLNREHIESFNFDNRLFINPNYNTYKKYDLEDKFHEVMTEGAINFLIVRNLDMQKNENIDHFVRKDSKILIHSDQIFEFRNKKSFLKAVPPDIKEEISKYIKKNKIRFKNAEDSIWIALVVYANELIQEKIGKE